MFGSVYVTLQFMVHVRHVRIHLAQSQCKYMWVHLWSEVVYAKDYTICIYAAVHKSYVFISKMQCIYYFLLYYINYISKGLILTWLQDSSKRFPIPERGAGRILGSGCTFPPCPVHHRLN